MAERQALDRVMNPMNLEHPYATGAVLGGAVAALAGNTISFWLHRGIHGGVEYSEKVKKVARKVNWLTTGMAQIDWVDHLAHHAYTDRYDEEAHSDWNDNRPEGAPEAPAEAFRDPYSRKLEKRLRVKFNTPGLHNKSYKKILPFIYELDEYDRQNGLETRDHWPSYLRNVDLEEGDPKAFRNRYKALGIAALWTTVGAVAGPKVAATGAATHVGILLNMGGVINEDAHTGQEKGVVNRAKVMLGLKEAVPDEDGETAANLLEGNEGVLAGELAHNDHHREPANPHLAGKTIRRDPSGWLISKLVKRGLATTPGAPEDSGTA